jgi:PncC family amidohydrolase
MVAVALTDVPGSSDVFERGFVTYSNAAKQEMLGVSGTTLATFGAVSEEVAREMAAGALGNSTATLAVAVTGIAGPGGSEHKPEGLTAPGSGGLIGDQKNVSMGQHSAEHTGNRCAAQRNDASAARIRMDDGRQPKPMGFGKVIVRKTDFQRILAGIEPDDDKRVGLSRRNGWVGRIGRSDI